MKKALWVMLLCIVLWTVLAVAASAGEIAQTIVEKLRIDIASIQSLTGQGNSTCFTAAWKVAKVDKVNLQADILLVPTFQQSMKWGVGGSFTIPPTISGVGLKLGGGRLDNDWVAYLGLPIFGSSDTTGANYAESDKGELSARLQTDGGIGLNYHLKF